MREGEMWTARTTLPKRPAGGHRGSNRLGDGAGEAEADPVAPVYTRGIGGTNANGSGSNSCL
jgi:hypothetical protein